MPNPDPKANPWITHETREIYSNAWISVVENKVTSPGGKPGIYGVVHFQHVAVGVVPVQDGFTWLVGQFRYPLNAYSWEIPEGGALDQETPEACAHRELGEETGLRAQKLESLGIIHNSNCATDEVAYLFTATGITEGPPHPDDTERLTVRKLPLLEAIAMVERGEITDAMSVVALLKMKFLNANR